jgi:hypothetical protein
MVWKSTRLEVTEQAWSIFGSRGRRGDCWGCDRKWLRPRYNDEAMMIKILDFRP